jgi:hypothetical protein
MNFADSGFLHDLAHVMFADATGCDDLNTARGGLNQAGNCLDSVLGGLSCTGGEDSVTTGFEHSFEGRVEIARHVEGAMKGDLERSGEFRQVAGPGEVDVAVGIENAKRNSVGAELLG